MKEALRHWRPDPSWYKPPLCVLVVNLSRFVMRVMNKVEFEGRERWEGAFAQRPGGILSFSNHVSLFDDPLLISNLGQTRYKQVRWMPADHKNFFGSRLKGFIYGGGKCVPIIRGGGLEQPGFAFLLERLRDGDWVHIFPEGGRTRDPDGLLSTPFKRGIGRLMAEGKPTLMPFYHHGMGEILPIGKALPRMGRKVKVHFGSPTLCDDAFLAGFEDEGDKEVLWHKLSDWSHVQLDALQRVVHPKAPLPENA